MNMDNWAQCGCCMALVLVEDEICFICGSQLDKTRIPLETTMLS